MVDKLYEKFLKPDVKYRGKPFWAWNGKLEKEELIKQIHVFKDMGFGGFFMHSRTGLKTEYLSDEWFNLINLCADEAEKLGMEAWLYDEDRWPSGTAGGMVTKEPKYRLKFIHLDVINGNDFRWDENIIAAFSCKVDGINIYDYKRITKFTDKSLYKNSEILKYTIEEMDKSSNYNGYTYVDTLNSEATNKFIELTHEKYKQHCGSRFGKTIKGIFTDEPHRGELMDGFGVINKNAEWNVPWTYKLFDNFKSKYGYDIVDKLPELYFRFNGNIVSKVKWDYVELLQEMFLDNYAKVINDWCKKNNMILTGHILHEDTLTAQTAMSGSVMRYYEYMDYPGVDVLTEYNKNFWIVKQLVSAARQLGKKNLLSEIYGCTGWQMRFENYKSVGDWQALFGINIRCPHLSWYTMEGEAKRDYPASIHYQSAWWKEFNYVEIYFSRIGLLMSQGKPCCDVLIINPVESVWCQIYPGWSKNLGTQSKDIIALEKKYADLFYWLCESQIDFDYGDEDMIKRLYSISRDKDGKPILKIGQSSYKCVVVSGMVTIRSTTLNILKKFINAGGKVIFAGDTPQYVDAEASKEAEKVSLNSIHIDFNKESIVSEIKSITNKIVEVVDKSTGKSLNDIYCQVRDDGKTKYIMLLNINRDEWHKDVEIRIYDKKYIEEWNCSNGNRFSIDLENSGSYISFLTDFAPSQEHLYIASSEKNSNLIVKPEYKLKTSVSYNGPFEYTLDEPNVCVLDMGEFSIDNEEFSSETEILHIDRIIRKRFGLSYRGGDMYQPWYVKNKKCDVKGNLRLRFKFYSEYCNINNVKLAMEEPKNFNIKLNGNTLNSNNINGFWIDKCIKCIDIPDYYIVKGENVIELSVPFSENINLESIYLLGNFGVKLDGTKKIIMKLPEKLNMGNAAEQGLPFYSGGITYKLNINPKYNKDEKIFLCIDSFSAACIKVISGKNDNHIIAWKPFMTEITDIIKENAVINLEVILTRRNTFGPLHQLPKEQLAYGPSNFITENENFSKNYMLINSGILEGIHINTYCK